MKTTTTKSMLIRMTAILGLMAPAVQAQNLLTNGSFEGGSGMFKFTNNPGNILISNNQPGEWISRESALNVNLRLEDVTSSTYGSISGQDGDASVLFTLGDQRGLLQYVDMTGIDLTGQEVLFSSLVTARSNNNSARAEIIGFDNPADVTADLGGLWNITSAPSTFDSFDSILLSGSDIDETDNGGAMTSISLSSGILATDYNYLAVLIGAEGGSNQTPGHESDYVAFDDVRLSVIPEPGTLALLGIGLGYLIYRRRR